MALGSRSIAVIGAQGVTGKILLGRLIDDPHINTVVAADPSFQGDLPSGVKKAPLDLMAGGALDALADLIDKYDLDTIVYTGYLSDRKDAQESQAEETRVIVSALMRRPVPKTIFCSTTAVYGALPGDPTHLSEDTLLVKDPHSNWVRDKVTAEGHVRDYVMETDETVSVLRFAVPLGPTIRNFMTDYLRRKAVPVVMGQDPSVQLIHEQDVAGAMHHFITNTHSGPFNIVGDGALPLSVALRIGRRRPAPVPELGSYPLHHALWEPDIIEAPAVLQDLFKYIWVADGTHAAQSASYSPGHSTKETVEDFYRHTQA